MAIGPVEYMVVGFPGNKFTGKITPALTDLVQSGAIRVIDLAFVTKDAEGTVAQFEVEDLESDAARAFKAIETVIGDLVNADDLSRIGTALAPNTSAAVLVWEDVWAKRFVEALEDAEGILLDIQRVPRDIAIAALDAAGARDEL
jgi:hypothetical protein